ncbi:hypothetical protein BX600DRAFT_384402 [Xylariales sp. PMI_506]|nr:hypothetical protein BX600DRAFT_384402 [Xylariales sp. PMI_506]
MYVLSVMDPLSLTLGIAGILPLIASAIKCAHEYRNSIHNRQQSIASLVAELEALEACLKQLGHFLSSDIPQNQSIKFDSSSVLRSCCLSCEGKLKELCKKLGQESDRKRSRFLWPLSEKEHEKAIQNIRNFTLWIRLALSIDGCILLSHTSEDVLQIMNQQLEQFKAIQSIEDQAKLIQLVVEREARLAADSRDKTLRKAILNWISATQHDQKHIVIQSTRVPRTGTWVLKDGLYSKWRDLDSKEAALWCHGIQGAGKTNIVSVIIDDLLDNISSSSSPVAYFYFDHQEHLTQSPGVLLRSILRQLVEVNQDIPSSIREMYQNISNTKSSIPQHECERLIAEVAGQSKCCFLILDALDECADPSYRYETLQILERLHKVENIKLLITSRPHVGDIEKTFCHFPQLRIEAKPEDIRVYLNNELDRHRVIQNFGFQFAERVLRVLSQRANGMFLLPVLQLRTILQEPSQGDMEDALNNLAGGLDAAFKETVRRIQSLPEGRRRLTMCTLLWVTYAERPLSEGELLDILATRPRQRIFSGSYRPQMSTVLESCQGFITLDQETRIVRPAHYAVQEYLIANGAELFPDALAVIACTCMEYLLFENFSTGPWDEQDEIGGYMSSYYFLTYASLYWGNHARICENDPRVMRTLRNYLRSPYAPAVATQVGRVHRSYRRVYWDADECRSTTPFHHAARRGLTSMVDEMLETGIDVNTSTKMGSTAINYAASHNHVSIVKVLLSHGADPYLRNWYGDALHCAVEAGSVGAMKVLAAWGMPLGEDHIVCALDRDRWQAFEAIVDLDVTRRFSEHVLLALLHGAAANGCSGIIEVFVRRRLVDIHCADKDGRTVMHHAAMGMNPDSVRILLNAGLDVNSTDNFGKRPMDYAAELYHAASAQSMEDAGGVRSSKEADAETVAT